MVCSKYEEEEVVNIKDIYNVKVAKEYCGGVVDDKVAGIDGKCE